MMKNWAIVLLLVLLTGVMPVLAQDTVVIQGDGGELNREGIQEAAEPLLARGATVVIYFVKTGGQADFYARLDEAGYTRNNGAFVQDKNLVAVYVSMERYSEILVGDTWADELTSSDLEAIRQNTLNPSLRLSQYSTALANTLNIIEQGIANPNAVTAPAFTFDEDTEEQSGGIPTGVVIMGVIIFFIIMTYLQHRYPEYFPQNSGGHNSWGSSSSRRSSSGGSRRSGGGSSGRGSRSGGSW
ncbi:MAG: hypothetical protein K8I82_27650 [Anaerolineae bacterium]|nr:hypothetical protein [Anaerolineae bacterium]